MQVEWVGCLLCRFEWPIEWEHDKDLREQVERSGECPICKEKKVVRR